MSDDIRELLRSADGGPAPVDLDDIQRRGRRLARTRTTMWAAAVAIVVAGVLGGLVRFGGSGADDTPVIDDPPAPTPSEDEGSADDDPGAAEEEGDGEVEPDGEAADDEAADDTGRVAELPTIAPSSIGVPLLLAGDDGVRRVDGDGEEVLWEGPVLEAASDLEGGIVLLETSDPPIEDPLWGFGTIQWVPRDSTAAQRRIAAEDERAVLHEVVELDGEPTVLFTRRSGELGTEAEQERLHAAGLDAGDERDLGETGGYESYLGGIGVAGDRLVASICHLQCRVEQRSISGDAESRELAGPTVQPGIDVASATAGWVGVFPGADGSGTQLRLTLHELDSETHREVPLASLPHGPEVVAVDALDLDRGLSSALVHVTWREQDTDGQQAGTLYVTDLDDGPEASWLETDARVRFADDQDGQDAGDEPQAPTAEDEQLIEDLLRFAREPGTGTAAALPFADEVGLGLGPELRRRVPASELADPDAWTMEIPGEGDEHFRGAVGSFSALALLEDAGDTSVTIGDHPHCASPPQPAPDEVAGLRRVSVQPELGPDSSCLQWWTVDLFVDDGGRVAAVTLDLWEP